MKWKYIATAVLLMGFSIDGAKLLAANPDCSRWVREYQQSLRDKAHKVHKHLVRASNAVHHPRLVVAKSTQVVVHHYRPHMSREEMLRRYKLLCGDDLPVEPITVEYLPELESLIPMVEAPVFEIAYSQPPAIFGGVPTEDNGWVPPEVGGYPTGGGGFGGFPVGGGGSPSFPGTPVVPPVTTPVSPTPEPDTLVLLSLGLAACIIAKRRS